MTGLLSVAGVVLVAALFYFFYKALVRLVAGVVLIAFGVLAYHLITSVQVEWPVAIVGCGLVAGALCIPAFLIVEIEAIEKKVDTLLSAAGAPATASTLKTQRGGTSGMTPAKSGDFQPHTAAPIAPDRPWSADLRRQIVEALESGDEIQVEWATAELEYHAAQQQIEAADLLKRSRIQRRQENPGGATRPGTSETDLA